MMQGVKEMKFGLPSRAWFTWLAAIPPFAAEPFNIALIMQMFPDYEDESAPLGALKAVAPGGKPLSQQEDDHVEKHLAG